MIKRKEVEALLREMRDALCRQHQGTWAPSAAFVQDHAALIEELARTWLRVNDAPVGEISEAGFNEDLRGFVQLMASDATVADVPIGQRVKLVLVPEADSGGEG